MKCLNVVKTPKIHHNPMNADDDFGELLKILEHEPNNMNQDSLLRYTRTKKRNTP